MSLLEAERVQARMAVVDEHIRCENRHDLDAVMATFGVDARYDDEPWGDHRTGREGVRSYYTEIMRALPDLAIEVKHRHVASESLVVEVTIRGTHLGPWRGLPATGRRLEFPLCGIYAFDAGDRLAGERIYYDRGAVLRQLGLFHEPAGWSGRVVTALSHPVTIARAYLRRSPRNSSESGSPPAA
ncbi:MAG TPA: ester cyclase [Pyrinomonadaceae bacterium]